MQRTIEELAAGKCCREASVLQFTPEKLEIEILEDAVYNGEFTIKSSEGIPVSGTVCSDSPRMKCRQTQFSGSVTVQEFEFCSTGLYAGDSQTGVFQIISDQGEYVLPFSVTVCKDYADSSQGKVESIIDFANLARASYDEAVKAFSRPQFESVFTPRESEEHLVFRGLRRKPCTRAQVEEFLIASRKKSRVRFQVEEVRRDFCGVTQTRKESVVLRKEEWGHFALEASADGAFLELAKTRVTDEDFVGSRGTLEYLIDADKLHAGRNFGRLTLKTPFQKEEISICVTKESVQSEHPAWEIRKKQIQLAQYYLAFGTHKTATGIWAKQTLKTLEELLQLLPGNQWYLLAKAQVYLVNRQRQEAEWALNSFPRNKADKESPLYAYYLYLCTLREPEQGYVNKCTGKIRKIYNKHQENPLLLWMLLFLDEDLNYSKGRKLDTIARYMRRGSESVLLYLEALRVLEKEPYLLGRITSFEKKLLNFAVKHQAMTDGIAAQVVKLLPEIPVFEDVWYKILAACYEASPSRDTLQAVCSYCIKGQCYGRKYWKWYQMGVAQELRIAGLHEAWVRSADKEQMEKPPRQIVLYFQSYSNFAGEAEALLYQAMIKSKAQWKNVWPHYSRNIQEFALKQLRAGRIDRALAAVYQEALTPELLTPERANDMAKVLFACEVQCGNPNARNLVLCQHCLEKEQSVPIVHGKAYVNIYCSSYQILLEDAKGRRFIPDEELQARPLLDSEKFLKKGISCAPEKLPYLLKYFDKKKIWQTFEEEDLRHLQMMINSPEISEAYRQELRPQMIAYFYDNYTGDTLDDFLLAQSFEGIGKQEREKIMRLLVARRHYRRAYELLSIYGTEQISPSKLVYVICHRMDELEEEECEDSFLLQLCREAFSKGKYNERILIYLCEHSEGSLSDLIKLWEAAQGFELDTYGLEERCLRQSLYTGDFPALMEKIFESYVNNLGKDAVILAYISQMAHLYLVKDAVVEAFLFHKIAGLMRQGKTLNRVCRLAFLKWCGNAGASGEDWELAGPVLEELVREGSYFAFFQSFPLKIQEKYMFHERVVVEYRTTPEAKVYINYLPIGSAAYVECEMRQMYDGIFAKDFLVFFEESIPYYIKEETDGEYKVTESGRIQRQGLAADGEGGRLAMIDDMMAAWQMKDEAALLKLLEAYGRMDELVKREFTLL
ncbi:MAG: hypothetical protein HFH36_12320 [Lachnospiraceae bacterium]|nr:hypothetical protein [Lachnospiraceae bacterium]